jgi:hypothetical protein
MPHLIMVALIGTGLYAAYRWIKQASDAITTELSQAEDERSSRAAAGRIEKNLGNLEYDAATGVYRPQKQG